MAFNLKRVLKALLFSSNQPLSVTEIQDVIVRFHEGATAPESGTAAAAAAGEVVAAPEMPVGDDASDAELYVDVPALVTAAQIREAMDQLAADLRAADDGILLTESAQGFRLVTHPRFARWIRALRNEPPPVKLSPTAMETLAVIAYRQPVTRAEIEHIRGVSAEAGLAKLLERELIYIVGRADLPGRPIQYGTTEAFLEFVGVRSLDELPATDVLSRQQINEWLQNAMRARHPSDSDMGLEEEGKEEQLSLADAARTAAAPAESPAAPPAESSAAPAAAPPAEATQPGDLTHP